MANILIVDNDIKHCKKIMQGLKMINEEISFFYLQGILMKLNI